MAAGAGSDAAYQGALGRTREERVHVWSADDGLARVVSVYRAVDASTHPELAERARAGTLHQLEGGTSLAIPFVYHDPDARQFLLVVPEALAHRVLSLRAELMAELAADTPHPVPEYVWDVEVVVGPGGLVRRLEAGRPRPLLAELRGLSPDQLRERTRQLSLRERELQRMAEGLAAPRAAYVATVTDATPVMDEELEELAGLEAPESPLVDQALFTRFAGGRRGAPDTIEIVADDEAEDVSELPIADDRESDIVRAVPVPSSMPPHRVPVQGGQPVALPPQTFVEDPGAQLCAAEHDGRVWVFVRAAAPGDAEPSDLELLVQVDPEAEVPVVMLTLVVDPLGSPEVRRGVLELSSPAQAAVLPALAEQFQVELVAVDGEGGLDHWATLQSPRELNVAAVLEHLEERARPDPESAREAALAALAHPPPWRDLSHPFQLGGPEGAPLTATEAAVALDQLADWLQPERVRRLRLLLSVPDELVVARCRDAIEDGLGWGLALPEPVSVLAVERGIARDEVELLERRIDGLCRTTRDPDTGGLGESVLRTLWADVLEQAGHHGVSLSPEVTALAVAQLGERGKEQAKALEVSDRLSMEPLRDRLGAREPDLRAARELALRGGHQELLQVCHAAGRMAPADAAALFVALAGRRDETTSDALLAALTHGRTVQERFGAALALASRHSPRAIDELARRVATEDARAWPAFANALGRLGGGSFRAISRALSDSGVEQARMVHVYAHLALHGARAQVRALSRKHAPEDARLGERALSLAASFKGVPTWARGLEEGSELAVFSRRFDERAGAEPSVDART